MPQRRRRRSDGWRCSQLVTGPQYGRPAISELHELSRPHSRFERRFTIPALRGCMRRLLPIILLAAAFAFQTFAQMPVASAPEQVGSPRGDDWQGYNILNSFEAGYRFVSV